MSAPITRRRHHLFVLWDGGGTVPVELGVARRLVERGHRVTVLGDPTIEDDAHAAGATFTPWRRGPHRRTKDAEDVLVRDWEIRSPTKLFAAVAAALLTGPAAEQIADVHEVIERDRPDVMALSLTLLGPMAAAEAAGIPFVALVSNLLPLPMEGVPPFGTGWSPARGPLGRARDRLARGMIDRTWTKHVAPLNAARASLGLEPLTHPMQQLERADTVLVLSAEAFEFPAPRPPRARYVGPVLDDPAWVEGWQPPAGDAPLVLVGLSSTFQDQLGTLQRITDALATLPVRAVVTTGPAIDPGDLRAPAHVQVVRSAPHAQVLAEASAIVTHGGHGTVMKALAAGVPVLCLPMGRDQPDDAARLVASGAGLRLKPSAKPPAIAAALQRLLRDPSFRQRAQGLGEHIRREVASGALVREVEAVGERADERPPADAAV